MDGKVEDLLQRLSEVTPKALEWAWEGLVPFGKVSLLTGEPGIGKSLVALQAAAMVTRGRSSPLSLAGLGAAGDLKSHPRAVVVLSAEDAADDTVLPRASIAGADVSRLFVLRGEGREEIPDVRGEQDQSRPGERHQRVSGPQGQTCRLIEKPVPDGDETQLFRLKRDLPRLEAALEQLHQAGEEVGLIVIDPIDRFLGPADKKRDRIEVVARLVDLAARSGAAVLVVANSSLKAGSRGSVVYQELMNSARSVLMVAQDLEDQSQRLLLPVKLNLSAMQPGRAFSIEEGAVRWKAEPVSISGDDYHQQVVVKGKNPLVREEVYEIQRVTRWLKDQLTPGRASSIWIRSNAGYYDICYSTLRRAFKILGCRATKTNNQWFWNLPGQEGSASTELLEEPLETPEGDLTGVFRESMPNWLRRENEAEERQRTETQQSASPICRDASAVFEEDAHQDAQRKSSQGLHQGAQQDVHCETPVDDAVPAWDRY